MSQGHLALLERNITSLKLASVPNDNGIRGEVTALGPGVLRLHSCPRLSKDLCHS